MENYLCTDSFAQLMECAQQDHAHIDDMLRSISKNIIPAAEQCSIGRMGIKIKQVSDFLSEGTTTNRDIYKSPEGYGGDPLVFEYKTYENGSLTVVCSAVKEHAFTDEEKQNAQQLARVIFLIASRTLARESMKLAAICDMLTGVYNINGLAQYAGRLVSEKRFADHIGIFINIKGFKYINSRVGARQGDQVLRIFCSRIKKYIGRDGAVARLGGDNFVVIIKKDRFEGFEEMMNCIEIEMGPFSVKLCSRMGIYDIKQGDGFPNMMNNVSLAIECCSRTSSDTVRLTDELMRRLIREKEVASCFEDAINNEEFVVFYQPKVDINTNELCGCEALARWKKDGRIISPCDFIPVLENEGLICRLDFYIFEAVCRDIRKWLDSGIKPVCVSTNLSKLHFHDVKLARKIAAILKKYDIPGEYIEAEITEMSGYEDIESMKLFVAEMHRNGIKTSIDDFGTGYSSLNMLKSLDVDVIKLDRTFVINIEKHIKHDEIVVRNIVNMVKELDMDIIAEGVENSEQAEFLKQINCRTVQGFLYDKPMPYEEFVERLSNRVYDTAQK